MSDDRIAEDLKRAEAMIEEVMKPDSEWRTLDRDEFVEEGDEIWLFSVKKWAPVKSFCTIGNPAKLYPRYKFRRRVSLVAKNATTQESGKATDKESSTVQVCPKCGFDSGWHNVECWMERAEKAERLVESLEQTIQILARDTADTVRLTKERDEAKRKLAVVMAAMEKIEYRLSGGDVDAPITSSLEIAREVLTKGKVK